MNLLNDLNQLGKNCDEVAKTLLKAGCRGKKNSLGECPIAHYLRKKGYHHPLVLPTYIVVGEEPNRIGMEAPALITAFVNRFDRKLYRDLEAY